MQENNLELFNKIEQKIKSLIKKSPFIRTNNTPNCELKNTPENFKIEIIENGQDYRLSEVQRLFNEVFTEEEVEPESILRSAVDGKTPWNTPDIKYRVAIVSNKEQILSVCAGAILNTNKEKSEVAYCVEYILKNPKSKQSGLSREVYISALIDSMKTAKKENKKLTFLFGGTTDSSEIFWNAIGWKRIYFKKENDYIELPYLQPILSFNLKTGKIIASLKEIKEHLMIEPLVKKPTKNDLIELHNALIDYTASWPKEAFENEELYYKHEIYINNLKLKFKKIIDEIDNFYILNKEEKDKL